MKFGNIPEIFWRSECMYERKIDLNDECKKNRSAESLLEVGGACDGVGEAFSDLVC